MSDEGLHQVRQHIHLIVHPVQQHGLRNQGKARIRQTGHCSLRFRSKFLRMIDMDRNIDRLARRLQRLDKFRCDTVRIGNRHSRVPADHFDLRDRGNRCRQRSGPRGGQHERVPARQDHFAHTGLRLDISERRLQFRRRQRFPDARPHHFPPETEAAINRTDSHRLQQDTVRITVHDPLHRRMRLIPDWIGQLVRRADHFFRLRHEHPGNRVARIVPVHAPRQKWGDGNGVAIRDRRQRLSLFGRDQSGRFQRLRCRQRPAHVSTGVHWTSWIERAPDARMTSRSNPSATPLASGMLPSASRKSSSIG